MNKIIFVITILLLIIPITSASTTIKLKTLPGHEVIISIWSPDFKTQYETPKRYTSDINGSVTHIYENEEPTFGVLVLVKLFGVQKYRNMSGPYSAGGVINLPNLLPERCTLPKNENNSPTKIKKTAE